jgi:hypothetical protein
MSETPPVGTPSLMSIVGLLTSIHSNMAGVKKGERSHARARMSGRRGLG